MSAEAATEDSRLTEFEGALLTELQRRQPCTAYQLRAAFQSSPSMSWSGSAGAVYPAVRRLQAEGLIRSVATADDARGARALSLTVAGEAAAADWICDARRAADSGFDPFRTRITLLDGLSPERREAFLDDLTATLHARIAWLDDYMTGQDAVSRARAAIDRAQQEHRLAWIAERRRQPPL
jgi:DNA-binding PadR family transcriptional regulator